MRRSRQDWNLALDSGHPLYYDYLIEKMEIMMKKKLLLIAGATCMLFGTPAMDANAEVNVNVGINSRPPAFVIDRRPTFIQMATPGFSMAIGSPYDIVYYGNAYYVNHGGLWYRSSDYRGPWRVVRDRDMPRRIRHYRVEEMRRFRDNEYRRHRDRYDRYDRYERDDRRPGGDRPGPGRPGDGPLPEPPRR